MPGLFRSRRRAAGGAVPRSKRIAAAGRRMRARLAVGRTKRIRQPVQFFKRTVYHNALIKSSQLGPTFENFTFKLDAVPNYTEFTALYDQYCIKGVSLTLMPRYNIAAPTPDGGVSATGQVPQTWSILDYDGSFPTTEAAMLQYQNLKMQKGTSWHKRYVVPAVSAEIFNGVTTAYAPKKRLFLDTANPDVKHYGATVMVPQVNVDTDCAWDVKIVYYLAFKNVR